MAETHKGMKRIGGPGVQLTLGISLAWAISIGFDQESWVAAVTSTPFAVWGVVLMWNLGMGLLERGSPRHQRIADRVRVGAFLAGVAGLVIYGLLILTPLSVYPEWFASRTDARSLSELDAKQPIACANTVKYVVQSHDHWLVRCGPNIITGKTFVSLTDPVADE